LAGQEVYFPALLIGRASAGALALHLLKATLHATGSDEK
jgi:hypothetical protein